MKSTMLAAVLVAFTALVLTPDLDESPGVMSQLASVTFDVEAADARTGIDPANLEQSVCPGAGVCANAISCATAEHCYKTNGEEMKLSEKYALYNWWKQNCGVFCRFARSLGGMLGL